MIFAEHLLTIISLAPNSIIQYVNYSNFSSFSYLIGLRFDLLFCFFRISHNVILYCFSVSFVSIHMSIHLFFFQFPIIQQ